MDSDLKKALEKMWEKLEEIDEKIDNITEEIDSIKSDIPPSLDDDITEIKSLILSISDG